MYLSTSSQTIFNNLKYIFWGLVFFIFYCIKPMYAHANIHEISSTCTLPYSDVIALEDVVIIAKSCAYTQAILQVQEKLNKNKAISYGLQNKRLRLSIATEFYDFTVQNEPKEFKTEDGDVQVTVNLFPFSAYKDENFAKILPRSDLLEMRLEFFELLQTYALKGKNILLNHTDTKKSLHKISTLELHQTVANIARQLEALWLYDDALRHFHDTWHEPTLVQDTLQKAIHLAPSLAAIWAAIGEVQLQLDQPQHALQSLNHALNLQPERPRTFYVRGLGHLRLQQPTLAKADLDTALTFKPQMASWLRARGAIALVLEDYTTMCDDFEQACALGDCEGLMHARERELCLP